MSDKKRSGGMIGADGSRDPNDEKVMATSFDPSGNKGRMIEASDTTLNATENSPIKAYYEFPQSNVKSVDTYSNRIGELSKVLGNRDEVKG